jgi:transcriptional regulator
MYQPDDFRVEDVSEMHALMRARPFAALVSFGSAGLYASHLPTVLKDEGPCGVVECHLARPNPHWKDLATPAISIGYFAKQSVIHYVRKTIEYFAEGGWQCLHDAT